VTILTSSQAQFDLGAVNQRWFERRDLYRPRQEPINPSQFGVEEIAYADGKAFVVEHHYAHSVSYPRAQFGLFMKDSPAAHSRLVGVAMFSPGSNPASISTYTGFAYGQGVELSRFCLLADVAGNGETFFLRRAFGLLKAKLPQVVTVLSYSDPVPRLNLETGDVVFPGHCGSIYAAHNSLYVGRAPAKTVYLNRRGESVSGRLFNKIIAGEEGHQYARELLARVSGVASLTGEDGREFVRRAKAAMRAVRHAGNHLYVWPLAADRREKAAIMRSAKLSVLGQEPIPYPKRVDAAA
jgi:hypothetical protein